MAEPASTAPDFGASAYSTGDVALLVRGVRDAQHLEALVAIVRRVRGVVRVDVVVEPAPGDHLLTVAQSRPTALASEIR